MAFTLAIVVTAASTTTFAARPRPRKPWFRVITSGLCLAAAKGADDRNATAGWATLGVGLAVWAMFDYWVLPSLDKSTEFPPARAAPRDPADDPLRMLMPKFGSGAAGLQLVMEAPRFTP